MTLLGKFNMMLSKGIFTLEVAFDALALAARGVRDLFYTGAARAATLADAEEVSAETFKSVDAKINTALDR